MGFLDKLAFWKKDSLDDFGGGDFGMDPGKGLGGDLGMQQGLGQDLSQPPSMGSDPLGLPPSQGMPDPSNFRGVQDSQARDQMNMSLGQQMRQAPPGFSSAPPSTPQFQEVTPGSSSHELEIIAAKLDAIKATMDALNQRMANLERYTYDEKKNQRW